MPRGRVEFFFQLHRCDSLYPKESLRESVDTLCRDGTDNVLSVCTFEGLLNSRILYGAYISRVFIFANFANLEVFAKLFQRNF